MLLLLAVAVPQLSSGDRIFDGQMEAADMQQRGGPASPRCSVTSPPLAVRPRSTVTERR